ncbi:MAG TPA: hypothetical protein VGC28_00705 [Sphingomonas sp.]
MTKTGAAIAALALLAGCKQTAGDIGNETNVAAVRLGNAADTLADRTDDWGDRASNRIDNASATDKRRIDTLNDKMGRLVDPGIPTDKWVGRWRGVEGLTLVIEKDAKRGAGHYLLAQRYTLDDKGVFAGHAVGDTIQFTRPDGDQVLRETNGMATGLKYLATKKVCLTVKPGEGYCRD